MQKFSKTHLLGWIIEHKSSDNERLTDWWDLELQKFWNVYSLIKKHYYEAEWVEKSDLVDWAIKWLVDALWDKHSEFLSVEETESFEKMLSWDFEWIWAVVDKLEIWVQIERLIKWSPAEKYGLLKDDVIIKADDFELKNLSLFDAVWKIKWPAWTKVLLTILRAWESEALEIEVVRQKIKIPSVEQKIFEDENIWYIAVNIFGHWTSEEFIKALEKTEDSKTDWLIIDLRNNGWGFLWSAVEILSEFIEGGKPLVVTKHKDRFFNEWYRSSNSWKMFWQKIVVLINGSSASASEITAWALQEYKKAIIVWEKSYGKWSVQTPYTLKDKSLLKLTIANWFTPIEDRNIDKEWIEPDVLIEFEREDYNLKACQESWKCDAEMEQKDFEIYDRQLEEAKKVLLEFLWSDTLQVVIDNANERLWNNDKKEIKEESETGEGVEE